VRADADGTQDADAPTAIGAIPGTEKGSKRKRFGPFYVISHAVARRLARLRVVPALVIVSATPPPE
jgi:hypothetical protein